MKPHRLILQIGFRAPSRCRSSAAATAPTAAGCPVHDQPRETTEIPRGVKPFEAIPSPKGLPIIGTAFDILRSGGAAKIHEYCDRRHKELGPIFKEKLGPVECVVISKKELIYRVYLAEGQFPQHLVPEPWLIYNEMRGIKRGLFFMDGEHWLKRRILLNKTLMAPSEVGKCGEEFNGVVTDLINRWDDLSKSNEDHAVPNLETELYNWSIESLGTMVFGRRLGSVTPASADNEMHDFVHNVQQIFTESAKLSLLNPKLAAKWNIPTWRRFVKAADTAIEMSRFYVQQRIAEIMELQKLGEEVPGVLAQMLHSDVISQDEIVNIVADLILAAADTTSHATQWALYSLAKNPETQERLLDEINKVAPNNQLITGELVSKIPYSAHIIKETLRMYPIASFLTRILPQKITLGGYEVPAGKLFVMSQYTVGRDPEQFSDPNEFKPERWAKDAPKTLRTSNCCMPFGTGSRACIGRRVAELKMRLLLSRVVQNFHMKVVNDEDVGIALRLITTPDKPIKISLQKRHT